MLFFENVDHEIGVQKAWRADMGEHYDLISFLHQEMP